MAPASLWQDYRWQSLIASAKVASPHPNQAGSCFLTTAATRRYWNHVSKNAGAAIIVARRSQLAVRFNPSCGVNFWVISPFTRRDHSLISASGVSQPMRGLSNNQKLDISTQLPFRQQDQENFCGRQNSPKSSSVSPLAHNGIQIFQVQSLLIDFQRIPTILCSTKVDNADSRRQEHLLRGLQLLHQNNRPRRCTSSQRWFRHMCRERWPCCSRKP